MPQLSVSSERWPLRQPFVISRQSIVEVDTVRVELRDRSGALGRGEAAGLDYKSETALTMRAQLESIRSEVESGCDRLRLIDVLPAGGARNALDAAMWDLEAKRGEGDPFSRTGLASRLVASAITLPIQSADVLAMSAFEAAGASWIKVKVGRDNVVETVRLVHETAPRAHLIVDPNQAWTPSELLDFAPKLAPLGVELLEQPIPVGAEAELTPWHKIIPLCADEACNGPEDLPRLVGRFDTINIKLDKIGGLTAALRLADAAETLGMSLMVGCMLAPSLAIAPAMVLAQRCRFVDLDAPPFLTRDSYPGFIFRDGRVEQPHLPALWG